MKPRITVHQRPNEFGRHVWLASGESWVEAGSAPSVERATRDAHRAAEKRMEATADA